MSSVTDLLDEWHRCQDCRLAAACSRRFTGEGSHTPKLVFVTDPWPQDGDWRQLGFLRSLASSAGVSDRDAYYLPVAGCDATPLPAGAVKQCFEVRAVPLLEALDPHVIIAAGDIPYKQLTRRPPQSGRARPTLAKLLKGGEPIDFEPVTRGVFRDVPRLGFAIPSVARLATTWSSELGSSTHKAYSAIEKAIAIAKEMSS